MMMMIERANQFIRVELHKDFPHLLIAQSVQKTIPTNIPIGKAAEAKITSLALAKPDFLPVKLAMKAIRKKPH